MTPDAPSEEQVGRAKTLVDELHRQLEDHLEGCEGCRIAEKIAI
jgi:hypothetical protein